MCDKKSNKAKKFDQIKKTRIKYESYLKAAAAATTASGNQMQYNWRQQQKDNNKQTNKQK